MIGLPDNDVGSKPLILARQQSIPESATGIRMSGGSRVAVLTSVAVLTVIVSLYLAIPAFAQTPTPVVPPTATPLPTGVSIQAPSALQIWGFVVVPLLFALVAIGIILRFIASSEDKYYQAAKKLAGQGRPATISYTGAFSSPIAPAATEEVAGQRTPPKELKIEGPGVVTAQEESAEFSATSGGQSVEAYWSVDPPGAAAITPKSDDLAKVRVVPTRAETFVLIAMASHGSIEPAKIQVQAISPKMEAATLPFIGQGYGTLVVAIIAIAAVLALALNGVLGGEAVATFFGGLLGYIFGVGTASATGAKPTPPPSGQPPAGGNTQ